MNKNKFFIIMIIGLLISNGALFYMLNNEHHRKGGPKNIIIDRLHFDELQIKKYEVYIQHHRKAVNTNEATMNKLRTDLFEQLKYEYNPSKIDSLISLISKQQNIAERINYNHFLEIKSLCKPNQKKDFDDLTSDIVHLFSPKGRK